MKNSRPHPMFLREAFSVKRYHTVMHVAVPETVGHHTCNVLAILFFLFDENPPLYLIRHALHHDAPEFVTGDVPATAKWKFPALAKALEQAEAEIVKAAGLEDHELDQEHSALMKYADIMDLCFKSVEELAFGNEAFQVILGNGLAYAKALLEGSLKNHKAAHALFSILQNNNFIEIHDFVEQGDSSVKH